MEDLRQAFARAIAQALQKEAEAVQGLLTTPPDVKLGLVAFPCFSLAKELRKAPPIIAAELATQVAAPEGCLVEAAGPYLNLKLVPGALARRTVGGIVAGIPVVAGEAGTVLVDYSSPNIGKELVYHHIRSTVIGAALCRIYAAGGWNVVAVNHLGDWGTQFGKLIRMFLREQGDHLETALAALPGVRLADLNRLYTGFKKAAEERPELESEARDWFRKLEEGDEFARTCWKRFVDATLDALNAVYTDLDARFDHFLGESFYEDKLPATLEAISAAGVLEESEGAQVVKVGENIPPCLIRKSDGSTLYATRDLAAALYRHEHFGFDRCLYVVDAGQSLHFRQVFEVLRRMQAPAAGKCVHVPFGLVLGKAEDGTWAKTSTRMGGGTPLRQVMDEAVERIRTLVQERGTEVENPGDLARAVGLGALVFNELKNRRQADTKFDLDSILSFEGETGPYVQYAHVRLCGILRKATVALATLETARWELLAEPETESLLVLLGKLPERIQAAIEGNEPSVISQYCLDVAGAFHDFYQKHRVLDGDAVPERLLLVDATRQVLAQAMQLVGLAPVERM